MKQIIILLIIFFVIRFLRKRYLMSYVKKGTQASGGSGRDRSEERSDGEEMVLDPVCDSYIPLSSALTTHTASGTEYFCSAECRDKFVGA